MDFKMNKELVTPTQCRSRVYKIIIGITVALIILHIILPGDLNERHQIIIKHINSILPDPFDIDFIQENILELEQDDPRLIKYVRVRHLNPPTNLPYNFGNLSTNPASYNDGLSSWVVNFFKSKRNGIFIEAGANEGVAGSHTMYLEMALGWTGLLVECNPTVVPYLKSKHRKAWVADVCLAPSTTPGVLNFSNPTGWTYSGTFRQPWNLSKAKEWKFFDVQTIPLYTVLAALGWTEVDYFSFDIEAGELDVLKTFPFDKIIFRVLIIEIYFYNDEEKKELKDLLLSNNYLFVKKLQMDWVFVHESVRDMIPAE